MSRILCTQNFLQAVSRRPIARKLINLRPIALSLLALSVTVTPLAAEPEETAVNSLGVCELHNLAGYSTIDAAGNLVILSQYCRQQAETQQQAETRQQQPRGTFWNSFTTVADAEAIHFASTMKQEEVVSYGDTICPFLERGGSLQELRQIQSGNKLPPEFEVAVTVAAINTYCPTYRSELGR